MHVKCSICLCYVLRVVVYVCTYIGVVYERGRITEHFFSPAACLGHLPLRVQAHFQYWTNGMYVRVEGEKGRQVQCCVVPHSVRA